MQPCSRRPRVAGLCLAHLGPSSVQLDEVLADDGGDQAAPDGVVLGGCDVSASFGHGPAHDVEAVRHLGRRVLHRVGEALDGASRDEEVGLGVGLLGDLDGEVAEARFRPELGEPRLTDTGQIGVGVDGHFIHRLAPWTTRPLVGAMLVLALLASLSACGSNEATDPAATSEQTSEPSPPATSPSEPAEEAMDIELTIGDDTFSATLDDSAAGRDLLTQLPVTLEMSDFGSVEKTGALPSPLSLEGQPAGADPDVGDLGFYAPDNDLVLYYGDQAFFAGIVVLGRLGDGAPAGIAAMEGTVTVTVTAAG